MTFLDEVPWNGEALIAVVAQDASTGRVLTVAWMNRDALKQTAEKASGLLVALAQALAQGEESGHVQKVVEFGRIATPMRCCSRWSRWAASRATPGARAAFPQTRERDAG